MGHKAALAAAFLIFGIVTSGHALSLASIQQTPGMVVESDNSKPKEYLLFKNEHRAYIVDTPDSDKSYDIIIVEPAYSKSPPEQARTNVSPAFEAISSGLSRLESAVAEMAKAINAVKENMSDIDKRYQANFQNLNEKVASLNNEIANIPQVKAATGYHTSVILGWILSLIAITLSILLVIIERKRGARINEQQTLVSDELRDLKFSLPGEPQEYIVPVDIMKKVGQEKPKPKRIFLFPSKSNPGQLEPLCRTNPVNRENMRSHIGHCPECQQILARP